MKLLTAFLTFFWVIYLTTISGFGQCLELSEGELKRHIKSNGADGVICLTLTDRNPSIPKQVFQCNNLEILNMKDVKLKEVPPALAGLRKLKTLNLSYNQFPTVPASIFDLKNIEELNLSGNDLTSIDPEMLKMQKLRTLKLARNKINSLDAGTIINSKIKYLDIGNNPISAYPKEFTGQHNLEYLDITGIPVLPSEILALRMNNFQCAVTYTDNSLGSTVVLYPVDETAIESLSAFFTESERGDLKATAQLAMKLEEVKHYSLAIYVYEKIHSKYSAKGSYEWFAVCSQLANLYLDDRKILSASQFKKTKFETVAEMEDVFKNNRGMKLRKELATSPINDVEHKTECTTIKSEAAKMYSDYLELLKRGLSEQFDSNQKRILSNEKSISSSAVRIKELEAENAKIKADQAKATPADKIKLDTKLNANNNILNIHRNGSFVQKSENEQLTKQNKLIKERMQKFNDEQGEISKIK
jgi:hypothetical protein